MYALIRNTKYVIWNYRKESLSSLISYYSRGLKIFFYLTGHIKLSKVLRPFHASGFISPKIFYIYLFKYLSNSFNTKEKLNILTSHYTFFKKNFPYHILKSIFSGGLKCWSETRGKDVFEMRLVSTTPFENEGSLCMVFYMNGVSLYQIAFTFASGETFGLLDNQIIYITRIQGSKGELDEISKSSKNFNDITPPVLLVSAIEGLALSLGIKTIIGISLENQLSYWVSDEFSFQKNYNEFWKIYDSVKIYSGDYMLPLPLQHKGIALIKSKHRSRALHKRKVRQEISRKVYAFFLSDVFSPKRIRFSPMRVVPEMRAIA